MGESSLGGCAKQTLLRAPWSVAVVALAGLCTLGYLMPATSAWVLQHLTGRLDALPHEPWRLLTGPLVHASWGHAARDLTTLLALGLVWERALGRRFFSLLGAGILIPPVVALALQPGLRLYFGLSAAVYAVLAAGLVLAWRRGGRRPWLLLLAAAVALKLVVEVASGDLLFPMGHPIGVRPVPLAHLVGAACALVNVNGTGETAQPAGNSSWTYIPRPR